MDVKLSHHPGGGYEIRHAEIVLRLLASATIQQIAEYKRFIFRETNLLSLHAVHFGVYFCQYLQAQVCNHHIGCALVLLALRFGDQFFSYEPLQQSWYVGIFVQHTTFDFST